VRERLPERAKAGNKGTFGSVLVLAGSARYPGAARLACEACYRAGAGLVTLACSERVQTIVGAATPEVVYAPLEEGASSLPGEMLRGGNVCLIGPGLGRGKSSDSLVFDLIARLPEQVRACVIDADGLNVLAESDDWHQRLSRAAILTPHPGEMGRLLKMDVAAVQADRLNVAMRAAKAWGHVVVLKGAHTIVAAPDGRAAVSPFANALLATAGTGDVLAGTIAGLAAQGLEPHEAAACGVYVHALAAEDLAEELGDRGMLASDLLPALPRAIRTIREGKRQPPMNLGGLFGSAGAATDPSALAGANPLGS
jgi:NAD(P)H-hydrate epimerase